MSRRHVLFLVLAAVALTAISAVLSRRDSRDWRANRSRRLFPFPWQDTAGLTITRPGGQRTEFRRKSSGEWEILLPEDLSDTAAYSAIDEFAALATLTWREPLEDASSPDPAESIVLTAVSAAGQQVTFAFGKTISGLRTVCIDGDTSVTYGVNQDLLQFLDRQENNFRNFYLASAGAAGKPKRVILSPPASAGENMVIELARADEGWSLLRPVAWPADDTRLDMLLRWAERMRAESIEAEMSGDLEWFGFGPDAAFTEIVYDMPDGKEIRRRVEFGGAAEEGKIYIREADRSPIFSISADVLAEVSLNIAAEHPSLWKNYYRRRTVNLVGDVIPSSVIVERLLPSPETLTIEQIRSRDGVRWMGRLESGGETREFRLDPPSADDPMRPLTALFTGLSNLRVKTFLHDGEPGPETLQWTAYPAWRYSYKTADGTASPAVTIYAAAATGILPSGSPFIDGDAQPQEMEPLPGFPERVGIAFSVSDRPAVMETFAELSYLLCLPPYRYQARKILDYNPQRWEKVEVISSGEVRTFFRRPGEVNEQWWLESAPPVPLMDDNNRFAAILLGLSQLYSDGFVNDGTGDIAKFGLDQPEITAIVYTFAAPEESGGPREPLFRIDIGSPAASAGSRFARVNGSGPVFLISGQLFSGLGDRYH